MWNEGAEVPLPVWPVPPARFPSQEEVVLACGSPKAGAEWHVAGLTPLLRAKSTWQFLNFISPWLLKN